MMIVELNLLELMEHKPIFTKGYQSVLHVHTVQEECMVRDIQKIWVKDDKGVEGEKKPDYAFSYARIQCIIQVNKPICIEKFSDVESMGRFTLRDEDRTIAVGRVIKYKPAKQEKVDEGLTEE